MEEGKEKSDIGNEHNNDEIKKLKPAIAQLDEKTRRKAERLQAGTRTRWNCAMPKARRWCCSKRKQNSVLVINY